MAFNLGTLWSCKLNTLLIFAVDHDLFVLMNRAWNLDPWNPGTLEPSNLGNLALWKVGTVEPWTPPTLESQNPATLEPWNPGARCWVVKLG